MGIINMLEDQSKADLMSSYIEKPIQYTFDSSRYHTAILDSIYFDERYSKFLYRLRQEDGDLPLMTFDSNQVRPVPQLCKDTPWMKTETLEDSK